MKPVSGLALFLEFQILWRFRKRLGEGVSLDLRQRYAGSILGLGWAVAFPILLLSIYALVYVAIFRVRPPGLTTYAYVVLVFSGLVPLLSFNEALLTSASSLTTNRSLLMNTVFPAELIPLRAVLAAQTTALFGLSVTITAAIIIGKASWITVVGVPFFWLMLVMFVSGLAWILSLVSLVLRDIQHLLGLMLLLLMILSPFAYTPDMVPQTLKALLYVNPLSYFVMSFQSVIVYGHWPSTFVTVMTVVLSASSFIGGFFFFRRTRLMFFDYV